MLDILLTCEKYIFALEKCPTSGRIWLNNKYCDYLIHGHGGIYFQKNWRNFRMSKFSNKNDTVKIAYKS